MYILPKSFDWNQCIFGFLYSIFYILYFTFYILYSIFYILYFIFYISYSIFYILYFIFYILYCILYIVVFFNNMLLMYRLNRSIESSVFFMIVLVNKFASTFKSGITKLCTRLACSGHLHHTRARLSFFGN
jgi:hypothetical protein